MTVFDCPTRSIRMNFNVYRQRLQWLHTIRARRKKLRPVFVFRSDFYFQSFQRHGYDHSGACVVIVIDISIADVAIAIMLVSVLVVTDGYCYGSDNVLWYGVTGMGVTGMGGHWYMGHWYGGH